MSRHHRHHDVDDDRSPLDGPRAGRRLRHGPHRGGRDDFGFFGPGRRRGHRSKRGDVRSAVLLLLEEEPRNGYQLIQELTERSGGAWRPSPGSIYPVLSLLKDEGLIDLEAVAQGRTYSLTDAGRAFVDENREALGAPWEDAARSIGEPGHELGGATRQLVGAVRQVFQTGTDAQQTQVAAVLNDARRSIYRILADEAPAD